MLKYNNNVRKKESVIIYNNIKSSFCFGMDETRLAESLF